MKNTSIDARQGRGGKLAVKRPERRASLSVFSEIRKDHDDFRKEMNRIRKLYDSDTEGAKDAYSTFRVRLHAHADSEERTLYQTLLGKTSVGEKLDDQVREGKEEHHVADLLLNELTQIPSADPKWKAKFRVLQESVEHHLEEEEEYMTSWKRKLSAADDRVVLEEFVRRRDRMIEEGMAARH